MRLAVSAEFIRPGRVGGAEQALHYMADGLIELVQRDRLKDLIVVGDEFEVAQPGCANFVAPPRRHATRFVQETMTLRALGDAVDAFYFPNYFTPPSRRSCRVVTAVHDLQYCHHPQNFSVTKRAWLRLAHEFTLRRADRVLTFSDFVRGDIIDRYGAKWATKVQTLRNPVSWDRFGETGGESPSRPYILSVASHYRHKNLPTLVRAFARIHDQYPDLELVLVGQLGKNLVGVSDHEDVEQLVATAGLTESVRVTGYVSAHELGELYRHAEVFVLPSLFEGFGLPAVEAIGFGLPVVVSGVTSLPEVTQGLARTVADPTNAEEFEAAIARELNTPERPDTAQLADFREYYSPVVVASELLDLIGQS